MKRLLVILLAVLLVISTLAGCGEEKEEKTPIITPVPTAAPTPTPSPAPSPSPTPEHGPKEDSLGILTYQVPDWDYTKEETADEEFADSIRMQTATYYLNTDGSMIYVAQLETEKYGDFSPSYYADMLLTANVQELGEGFVLPLLNKYDVYCGTLSFEGDESDAKYVSGYFRYGENIMVMVEVGLVRDDIEEVWDYFENFLNTIQIQGEEPPEE